MLRVRHLPGVWCVVSLFGASFTLQSIPLEKTGSKIVKLGIKDQSLPAKKGTLNRSNKDTPRAGRQS